jgi:DNA-binding NarL/FixJ family response regulator
MMRGGRVLIADDHPLSREGLALAVRSSFQGAAIDAAGSVAEACAAVRTHQTYRLILLDFVLPDARGFSGLIALQQLSRGSPLAMISAYDDATLVETARSLGAVGFLYKTNSLDALMRQLMVIAEGGTCFPPTGTALPAARAIGDVIETLSDAQRKVLFALADGRLNKQIAGDLGLAEATVKAHLTAIFRKLNVVNRAQAMLAIQPVLGKLKPDVAR